MFGTSYARLLVGALLLLLPGIAAAQISVVKNADMGFGSLGTSASPGTAVLNATTGVVTVTGGVVNLGGTQTAASFTVSVPPPGNPSYTIVLPTSVTLTGPGAATMSVDTFTSNPACCAGFGRSQTVTVGATLHVAANQAGGDYSGTALFVVTRP
jgi:Domain of unknown function (DUF4402)